MGGFLRTSVFSKTADFFSNPLVLKITTFFRNPVILTDSKKVRLVSETYNNGLNTTYIELKDIYQGVAVSQTIIYCNSTRRVDDLHEAMSLDKFPVNIKLDDNIFH